ncbi:Prefoldin, subunit 4 [Teratosphaeria destructans]|uniref:Prefoldin, subunit 4 n=1 Tax=Teratosphaeria destructans TaxID=418781 RepID=A0A9W7W3E6_9PEZI|nr:Prefoldin, subunit 4 [Teratosphaeria destructans]
MMIRPRYHLQHPPPTPFKAKQHAVPSHADENRLSQLSREEEAQIGDDDKEVRKEDQDRINRFSRLHGRERGLEEQLRAKEKEREDLEDISNELELADDDDKVPYKIGDSFFALPASEAQALLSRAVETINGDVAALEAKLGDMRDEMRALKAALYGRFGRSINLEA